ncbi:Imm1 family immunity protein [Nocardia sp. NBC_01730]|uniref:Imm1 family immunity protein n=1 Tax=Nocardia sp. NBC_01730 TaxID=2975998 RepID=UPI002E135788|nr:Imm1 family immunity protein [Nocardia sp. NBC_01730]
MQYVLVDHLAHREPLEDSRHAVEQFDDTISEILPHGMSGQTVWIEPEEPEGAGLRVDIDIDVNRAALTWMADDTIGVELEPGPPITVMWSVDAPRITVPGTVARVSVETARRAVADYVATGHRPALVCWTRR